MNKVVRLLSDIIPIKSLPKGKKSSVHSFLKVLRNVTVLMHINLLHATVQRGVIVFKILVLISPTFQWHMLTPSESTFLLWLYIYSLPGFWISVMHSRIQISNSLNSLCQFTTLLSRLVWNILPQWSLQLRRITVLSLTHERNPGGKGIRTTM